MTFLVTRTNTHLLQYYVSCLVYDSCMCVQTPVNILITFSRLRAQHPHLNSQQQFPSISSRRPLSPKGAPCRQTGYQIKATVSSRRKGDQIKATVSSRQTGDQIKATIGSVSREQVEGRRSWRCQKSHWFKVRALNWIVVIAVAFCQGSCSALGCCCSFCIGLRFVLWI
jgi:hypothetical protein